MDEPAAALTSVALAGVLFLDVQGAMVDDLREERVMLNPLFKTLIDHIALVLPHVLFLAKVHT